MKNIIVIFYYNVTMLKIPIFDEDIFFNIDGNLKIYEAKQITKDYYNRTLCILKECKPYHLLLHYAKYAVVKRKITTERSYFGNYHIFIKTPSNEYMTFDVTKHDTIYDVKQKIYHLKNIPINQQSLLWCGAQLMNVKRLKDYNISKESTLHLLMHMRGGGDSFVDVEQKLIEGSWTSNAPQNGVIVIMD